MVVDCTLVVAGRVLVVRRVVVVRAVDGGGGGTVAGTSVDAAVPDVDVSSGGGGNRVVGGSSALPLDPQAVAANRLARAAAEAMPSRRSHGRRRPRRLQARAITTGPIPPCAAMARG